MKHVSIPKQEIAPVLTFAKKNIHLKSGFYSQAKYEVQYLPNC